MAAAASLSPREAALSTKSSRLARCAPQPKLTRFSAQRTRARTLQARSLLATRTQAHVLLARCFRLRRLLSLASRAADFFGLGTPRALAVAGLAWQPAGCWLACGDVALAGCEASAFVRSFWSHSHCARRRLPPVSSSSSTTSLLADHSAEPRSGGDDIVIDGCFLFLTHCENTRRETRQARTRLSKFVLRCVQLMVGLPCPIGLKAIQRVPKTSPARATARSGFWTSPVSSPYFTKIWG